MDRRDREHFLELLVNARERFRLRLHAYCLMSNHYHLLMGTPDANVSEAIQWLNGSYGIWHNLRHDRTGHLFGERFKAVLVEDEAWGLEVSAYVHMNPVAPGQKESGSEERKAQKQGLLGPPKEEKVLRQLERLRLYEWSSYRAYAGYGTVPEWLDNGVLLRRAGGKNGYRSMVEDQVKQGTREDMSARIRWGLVLGGERFARKVRGKVRICRETDGKRELGRRRTFEEIVRIVERVKKEPWEAFRDRYGDWGRDAVLWACRQYGGMTLKEAGRSAGGVDYVAVAAAVRRISERAGTDRSLRSVLGRLRKECIK